MEEQVSQYEFINSQTGNVLAYVSLPLDTDSHEVHDKLEKKRAELAIANQLYVGLIYWQEHGHAIR